MEVERFRKHMKNITTKVATSVTLMLQKEFPQSYLLFVFKVPIPAWSPGPSLTGSEAQKHAKIENQVRNSCNILSKMESKRVPIFGRM